MNRYRRGVPARRAIFVAPFGELSEARTLARLAEAAESAGWDGFFLWDHLVYTATREVADPWVAMAAIACATERVLIGPLVTPTPRRRIQKLARETVTLDRLSGGRLVFGVGIGGNRHGEFVPFGDPGDPRERARLLDEGLDRLVELWGGEFAPSPAQTPRIPVWVGARWPNRRPVRRAARWDGLFPVELPGPDELAQLVAEVQELRDGADGPYDVVVTNPPGTDRAPWEAAGATWCLTGFGPAPTEAEVMEAIEAG
jgi:alkanesulfonate monooxygenase SsuD/methylene tetrahydromethanopterin reductase-like flavin-dependent oxidoreductase (luciferase family)